VSSPAVADLRRVTLVAPQGRFDVALPAGVPLAYLVPTLLQQAGADLAEAGVAHGGWVVQRLGGWPFDTGQSAAALGIADGEILYLRPRRAELPPPVFDDAAEAISRTLAEQTPRWDLAASRVAALCAVGALLAVSIAGLLLAGPPWRLPAVAAGAAALTLLAAGGLMSRAAGDALTGAVLGCGAGAFGALAGFLGFAHQHAALTGAGAGGVLAGSSVGLATEVLAAVLVGTGTPLFAAASAVGVAGVAAGLAAPHATVGGGAAVALCAGFLLMPFIPVLSYRAAGLPRPFLPGTTEELRRGADTVPGEELARRTLLASSYMSCLVAACAVISVAAAGFLLASPGWPGPALACVAALLALLRSRVFTGRAQRGWLTGAAVAVTVTAMTGLAVRSGGHAAAATGIAALAAMAAIAVAVHAARSGGQRGSRSPLTGRLLDLAELAAAVATIPLVLEVLGVYARLRAH
jgi:type VII secretion integral membrane protein EccD